MALYQKKPVVVEARQYDGSNAKELLGWITKHGGRAVYHDMKHVVPIPVFVITTLEGHMTVSVGDYIIKGVQGEFYPCKPDIFAETYELADIQPDVLLATIEERNKRMAQEKTEYDRA